MRDDLGKLLWRSCHDFEVIVSIGAFRYLKRFGDNLRRAVSSDIDRVAAGFQVSQHRRRIAGARIELQQVPDMLDLFCERLVDRPSEIAVMLVTYDAASRLSPSHRIRQNVLRLRIFG